MLNTIKTLSINHLKNKTIFNEIFSEKLFSELILKHDTGLRSRVFNAETMLWCFLNQSLNYDHSCKSVVSNLISHRLSKGLKSISASTGAYCQARKKFSLDLLKELCRSISKKLEANVEKSLWEDHDIKLVDGSELRLPVTNENLKVFPKTKDSDGLLKCRLLGIFSFETGAILDLELSAYWGKGTGEISMFRKTIKSFGKRDLLVMDRMFSSIREFRSILQRQANFLVRERTKKKRKLITIKKLSKNDRIVRCPEQKGLEDLILREVKYKYKRDGFRTKEIVLLTSLLDHKKYCYLQLCNLYGERWNVEVDFRNIKSCLGLSVLRSKSPEMVEKEIWIYLFGHNYMRTVMADVAHVKSLRCREVSFKECLQMINGFQMLRAIDNMKEDYLRMIEAFVIKVKNRPGRLEPRALRNNPQKFRLLKVSREEGRKINWIRSGKKKSVSIAA
jgi:hypothetical protein